MAVMDEELLIDAIYEAGALPELWPELLQTIADRHGARGGTIIWTSPARQKRLSSASIAEIVEDFFQQGWGESNSRIERYLARPPYAGFLTDTDLHSEEEVRSLPIYRDFLVPRGADAGAATLIQGVADDSFAVTLEGFAGHGEARGALASLDRLRPHLARATALSGRLQLERSRAAITALDLIGTPAAILGFEGRLHIANARFEQALGSLVLDRGNRIHLVDERSDRLLGAAMHRLLHDREGSSLPVRRAEGLPLVLHLVPVRGSARDIFFGGLAFALLTDPCERSLPDANLLQSLFDLTPGEARIARSVSHGTGIKGVARETGLSPETIRSHLKAVFQKTGSTRQSELSALLTRYASTIGPASGEAQPPSAMGSAGSDR